ncbi:hypothetical protein SFRURICE_018699, partial [Spodoptera frugiperda]
MCQLPSVTVRRKCVFFVWPPTNWVEKLLKANPPVTSVTGDHHSVQCVNGRNPPQPPVPLQL